VFNLAIFTHVKTAIFVVVGISMAAAAGQVIGHRVLVAALLTSGGWMDGLAMELSFGNLSNLLNTYVVSIQKMGIT
jgi:hypothetical protein